MTERADSLDRTAPATAKSVPGRVVVAMSGGVDSSLVAALLKRQGYDVIGITLQLYDHGEATARKGACCAGQDIHDARRVADLIGIPHYVLDYERRFADLAPEQRQSLHSEVGPRLIALAAEHAGVRIMRSEPGQGGYMDRIAPDWQIRVLGSPEQIAAFSDFLGLGGQQTSVIHSRIHKSASGRAAIFTLPAGTTHESAATAWRELQRILPRLAEDGYSFVEAEGQRQMRVFPGNEARAKSFVREWNLREKADLKAAASAISGVLDGNEVG